MTSYEYQVGGSLKTDAPTYVERQADSDLYTSLMRGEFCYVFSSRQMGKSSLRLRTKQRLERAGFSCASIDMTRIGSETITPAQWYKGIAVDLLRGFNLFGKVNLKAWWQERDDLSFLQRLSLFIEDILLVHIKSEKFFIFVDEIDSVLSLNFPIDDFFALIRSCYNQRAENPEYNRLTWALFGVATPSDLIQDRKRTPFNIGRAIDLHGFQLSEVQPLAAGLADKVANPITVLKEILAWTGGQPFLTQKLCQLVVQERESGSTRGQEYKDSKAEDNYELDYQLPIVNYDLIRVFYQLSSPIIEKLVRSHIIENWEANDEPEHLKTIRDRLCRCSKGNRSIANEQQTSRLLELYQQILQEIEVPLDDSKEQIELLLSGLVIKYQGQMKVKNRIYQEVFNLAWVEQQLEDVRPYSQALAAWIATDRRNTSHLLRGQALLEAQQWAASHNLSGLDYQFLTASQELVYQDLNLTVETEIQALKASQAAISQENARLSEQLEEYSQTLEAKVEERTQALQQEIRYRQQAEEKFALAFRASPYPITISTLTEGRYLEVNDSFCRISGYELDEIIGHTAFELNIWVNLEDRDRTIQMLREKGTVRSQEIDFRTKSGDIRTMLLSTEIIYLYGQACLLSISNDITKRKQAEEELRTSEERFRTLVNQATDSIFLIAPEGKLIDVNQRACENLGYTRDELLSLSLPDIEKKFTPETIEELRKQFALGQIATVEGIHQRKDGTQFPVEVRAGRFESGGQQLEIALIRDITERKQREEALRAIAQGTAAKTGSEFFRSLVRHTAEVLQVRYAFVTEFANEAKTRLRTLAFWQGETWKENFEYDLTHTPCEGILEGRVYYYPKNVPALFPGDLELAKLGVESFLGIPLVDSTGNLLGHLAVMDVKPMTNDPSRESIVKIFAARVGAELERLLAEKALAVRAEIDSLLSSISRQFLDRDVDTAISFSLQVLGEFTQADRTYVFRYFDNQTKFKNTHEWCNVGITPFIDSLQDLSVDTFAWHHKQLLSGELLKIPRVADLPPEAAAEKIEFERESIQSLLAAPLLYFGDVVGFIGLDAVRVPKEWSQQEINLLKIVSEMIAIAQARHEAEQALKESEARYRSLYNRTPVMLHSTDSELRIVSVSDHWLEFSGYSREEILGKKPIAFLTQESRHRAVEIHIPQFLQAGFSKDIPYQFVKKNGEIADILLSAIAECNSSGKLIRSLVVIVDVTERKRAEVALQQAVISAEVANRAKSEFLANMSHELRTPLNAILGFTQLMSRDCSLNSSQLEHLEIINRSGEHLLTLINDVLSMAKIEAGQTTLNENSFDLYRLLDAIEQMFKLKAESKGLQLTFEHSPDVPQYVRTDESKLRQVLINLLGNAIKFTSEGSVTLKVTRKKGKGKSEEDSFVLPFNFLLLTFSISDTGSGIAPTEFESLFEPFVQTQTGRTSQQGTGLGLPISRQFVRLMGGKIRVNSTLGEGTTFSFDIQVNPADMAEIPPQKLTRRIIALAPNQTRYRILVVEDKWENRQLLVKLLESLGFEVREAENGKEGVAIWETWEPHLIWMDMRMPVMDGYEATKLIKSHLKGQATVIIALTATAFEETRSVILSAGCDDFVGKPFQEEAILEKMAHYLGVRYIYAEEEALPNTQSGEALNIEDGAIEAALSQMPQAWVQALHQAALCTEEKQIFNLIEQIPLEFTSLAHTLTDLVDNFRIDKIIDLTQPDCE
jgi:two-component system sensor histidine kinase/response regulator